MTESPRRTEAIHPLLADLDTAPVDALLAREQLQQRAVAAAYVEQARAGLYKFGDQAMIGAGDLAPQACVH